jgi:hypothetical protein
MQRNLQLTIGAAMLTLALAATAQKPAVYPAKGQSASQQSKDDGECGKWAQQNSGVNPSAPPPAQAAAPPPPKGGRAKGAAVGATVGAIGDNDVGNAAVKGAVVGGVAQRNRARGQQEAAAAQNQQAQAQQQQDMGKYYKSWGACMSGRGYSVN